MNKFEIANILKQELIHYLEKGIGFSTNRYDIKNITDYETSSFNEMEFVSSCENRGQSLTWDFGFGYDNNEIHNLVPYPWALNVGPIIRTAVLGHISESDFKRYFEICHETENIIFEAMAEKIEKACGTDKFNLAAVDFFNMFMKYVKESIRGLSIEDHFIEYATYKNKEHKCTMRFEKPITYAQKRKIKAYLGYKLMAFYKKLNPDIKYLTNINMNYWFDDNGRKAAPTDCMRVSVRANDWNAIGMDQSAAFVPRMGMKRNTTI